jgi:transcriptional regulator with XRE-family HTH domain
MNIGDRIKDLRKTKGITLQELSHKSGVALATLSRMENGKMTGTINSHQMICKALNASMADLYREVENSAKIVESVSHEKRVEHFIHSDKAKYELLIAKPEEKSVTPLILKIDSGGETHKEETRPGIEKFMYLMSGSLEASVGDKIFLLKRGDSLYFDASLPHYFKNTSKTPAEAICVITPAVA